MITLKDKNEVVQEFISIVNGSGTTVDYVTTVFGSTYREYTQNMTSNVEGKIYEGTKKKIWNTSLTFESSVDNIFHTSAKDRGVNFGWLMLDYQSNIPQVCTVIEFVGNNVYNYKSATFDKEVKNFVNSQNGSVTTTKLDELVNFMLEKFNLDLDKYKLETPTKKES